MRWEWQRIRCGVLAVSGSCLLALALLPASVHAAAYDLSMSVRTGDYVGGHRVWSVDGLSPDALNDVGEVAFLDLYTPNSDDQAALSSTHLFVEVGDLVDTATFAGVQAGYRAALDGGGGVAFRGKFDAPPHTPVALFAEPDFAALSIHDFDGYPISNPTDPASNEAGDLVFAANYCPGGSCSRSWLFDRGGLLLADDLQIGSRFVSDFYKPSLNEKGDVAFLGNYTEDLALRRGVFLWDGSNASTLLAAGDVLDGTELGSTCCPQSDLDDAGRVAIIWPDTVHNQLLIVGDQIALRSGDTVEGLLVTRISPNAVPSINGAGLWAVPVGLDGAGDTTAMVAGESVVAKLGDRVAGEELFQTWNPSVNDLGQIAFQGVLGEGSCPFTCPPHAVVLATPAATNARARLTSASPSSISQTLTAPLAATDVRLGYRFEAQIGELSVRFKGETLGSVVPADMPESGYGRARFLVDGALLGQAGALEIVVDGPTGASVLVDDVVFPGIENGHFQSEGLEGWETSGQVALVVPEAGSALGSLCALLLLCGLLRRRHRPSPTGR